ncbi:unnamed protein product [Peniophora sp. CBMAI 1063]|nr:unnamed protein product [Peniophora sp. CBMAI 1063]
MAPASEAQFLRFAIQWASIALLYYDYALTFPHEVKYIWRGSKRRLLVFLYICCRYALLANVLYLLAISDKFGGPSACDAAYKALGVMSVLGRGAIIFTFLARVYVVCSRNKIILGGLGAIAATCVVLDVMHVPGLRCSGSSSIKIVERLLSILICVFEFFAAVIIFFRSMQALRLSGAPLWMTRDTFSYLVVEQDVLYFAFISIFTTGTTILNFRAPTAFIQRLLNALTLPLSGLLTARFILRLRAYHGRRMGNGSVDLAVPISTFEIATDGDQHMHTIFTEFGEDPVLTVAQVANARQRRHSAHGLRFAVGPYTKKGSTTQHRGYL